MERLSYILDTNVVADYINQIEVTTSRTKQAIRGGHILYLCQPVHYEIMRGLFKVNAARKLKAFEEQFAPQLLALTLTDTDWLQAARFWADMRNLGRQFADADLLVAALAKRLDSIVVTADDDFDALPIRRENWRITP
ncbi:MAG: PIN domain-containing protein [Anaerolineae bacterium]|nr:PIN domain-containing protein [Anaerolineae bacterium]MDQ7033937.1 PIN domain-containing protein [Anaerolineae bacterium]